jgi:hypothetical protein
MLGLRRSMRRRRKALHNRSKYLSFNPTPTKQTQGIRNVIQIDKDLSVYVMTSISYDVNLININILIKNYNCECEESFQLAILRLLV